MSRLAHIPVSTLTQIVKHLEALPDPGAETMTKREAVHHLLPQISALKRRGYTVQAIAEQLTAEGLPITRAVLQKYMSELKGRPRVRRGDTSRALQALDHPPHAKVEPAAHDEAVSRAPRAPIAHPNASPLQPNVRHPKGAPSASRAFTVREDSDDL